MRNSTRSILTDVAKASALSLALVGVAQAADGIGFHPWTDARRQDVAVGESYPGAPSQFGFQPWSDRAQLVEVIEPYTGPQPWTDSVKCMTDAAYCHRFDATPVKAELAAQ